MAELVVLPKLGLTASGATLTGWLVEVGAEVAAGAALCEIETDKITVEVEAPVAGVLLARVEIGIEIPIGAVIAVLGLPGERVDPTIVYAPGAGAEGLATDPLAPAAPANRPSPTGPTAMGTAGREHRPTSPAARARALQLGMDLASVTGTGPNGRITLEDVEAGAAGPDPE